MEDSLKLRDPVTIEHKSRHPSTPSSPFSTKSNSNSSSKSNSTSLQGVVAYLGSVSFADGYDWVGVRLTGNSINHGKNDGSVRGVRYFEQCGMNSGIFVQRGRVKVRTLSPLMESSLKRDLKGIDGSSAGADGIEGGSMGGSSRKLMRKGSSQSRMTRPRSSRSLSTFHEDEASVQSMYVSPEKLLSREERQEGLVDRQEGMEKQLEVMEERLESLMERVAIIEVNTVVPVDTTTTMVAAEPPGKLGSVVSKLVAGFNSSGTITAPVVGGGLFHKSNSEGNGDSKKKRNQ